MKKEKRKSEKKHKQPRTTCSSLCVCK